MSIKITEIPPEIRARVDSGAISTQRLAAYEGFLNEVESKFLNHRVIVDNAYCKWFEKGAMTLEQLRHFIQEFSVFSHLFLVAQLKKMINARSLESYRASKEILANEIGVIFRNPGKSTRTEAKRMTEKEKDLSTDPELVSTQGTVDGGTFKFKAGHFEWLLEIGRQVGLDFSSMGKRKHGTASTLFFCEELERLYGNEDPSTGEGASFAVENWAAAGFWKQLIRGLKKFKEREVHDLKLAFFTWHDAVEDQHAAHTFDELAQVFFQEGFERTKFISGGQQMLDAVAQFWDGLHQDLHLSARET